MAAYVRYACDARIWKLRRLWKFSIRSGSFFGGVRFDGDAARIVLIVEAGILRVRGDRQVFAEQRWCLLLASVLAWRKVVMSLSSFVIAYLRFAPNG